MDFRFCYQEVQLVSYWYAHQSIHVISFFEYSCHRKRSSNCHGPFNTANGTPVGKARSCLFLADAHTDVICASVKRLLQARGQARLRVDAVKVAHHGSKGNTSDELMSLIESPRFQFSTNGQQFGHPDEEAVGRVIGRSSYPSPTLYFNYLSEHNRVWQQRQQQFGYKAVFNDDSGAPMLITL